MAKLPNKRSNPTSFWYQVGKETRSFWRKLGKKYLAIKWWNNSRTLHMIWHSGWRRCGLEWGRRSQIAHTLGDAAPAGHSPEPPIFMKTWPRPDDTLTPHTGPHRGAAHTVDKPLANMVADRPCQATSPKIPGSDNKGSAAYCWQQSDLFQAVARARTAPAPQIATATTGRHGPEPGEQRRKNLSHWQYHTALTRRLASGDGSDANEN